MSDTHAVRGEFHCIENQEISWAVQCPSTGMLVCGTENGLFFRLSDSKGPLEACEVANEAINGIAFAGAVLAISTRTEVALFHCSPDGLQRLQHSYTGGAHGIVASASGSFVAPVGLEGLLILSRVDNENHDVRLIQNSREPVNCYKLTSLGQDRGKEVFVCAARRQGVFAFRHGGAENFSGVFGHVFPGDDIVDVCGLKDPTNPFAAIAITRQRRLLLLPDVLGAGEPLAIDFPELIGVAYAVVASNGHVFVLTDREFITIPYLAERFLRRELTDGPIGVSVMSVHASDLLARNDDALLLFQDGHLIEYKVADLLGTEAAGNSSVENQAIQVKRLFDTVVIQPEWTTLEPHFEASQAA